MDGILEALATQHAELDGVLDGLSDAQWDTPVPRCPGWTIADVVLHLVQTDELAAASASGAFDGQAALFAGADVDEGAAVQVDQERGASPPELLARWRAGSAAQRDAFASADPNVRLPWVTNTLAPATLATTRLAESWIHTNDITDALGIDRPTDATRLRNIAWLAWKTLAYAFERAGEHLSGPIVAVLTAPDGGEWVFGDPETAATTITGPAEDWCLVAARRRAPAETNLRGAGPDGERVLALVRTYA